MRGDTCPACPGELSVRVRPDRTAPHRTAQPQMADLLPTLGPEPAEPRDALLDVLLADVDRHTGGRSTDDMALLAVTRGRANG
ncbi:hypothetical protein AQJ91_46325 [Streptomyces dysideae]|uniref:PPM-type phosphatase domain-containing protein n=1 Tax=Streptomyces dysideae TaxID=909626 RepID=A0A117RX72_9ACTN|nr:hypothetical protein AQJ91_46325 [Streptomyces dysideae]